MTRRWTNVPTADEVPYTPPDNCCFDATTVQEAIDELANVHKLIAIKMDGTLVVSICDLVVWVGTGYRLLKKVVQ